MKLYQLYDGSFGTERFCFNAENDSEANTKRLNWLRHHGMLDRESLDTFLVREVESPQYENNIHNEWV